MDTIQHVRPGVQYPPVLITTGLNDPRVCGGIIYGWLRFSSGSLLFPLLAHSLANVAFHLTAL